uniref:hypothetical protein n=1 Tax=Marinobacterium profundum TaxID=1714300 RepID=UPI000835FF93|nr:hypothetical protein [Marinobacterium profundum]
MKLKSLPIFAIALSLGACASVPPPPHCEDNGQGLQPINPEMITQEQANAIRAPEKDASQGYNFAGQGGNDK